jgi:hypothetical protein
MAEAAGDRRYQSDCGKVDPRGREQPVVRIGLFGGVSAATDGGEPVDVGSAKCQTVLAVLALAAGTAVPVPRIVELV